MLKYSSYILLFTCLLLVLAFLFTLPGLLRNQKESSLSPKQTTTQASETSAPATNSSTSSTETSTTGLSSSLPETTISEVQMSNNDENWALFLVNSNNLLPEGYEPATEVVYKGAKNYEFDSRAAPELLKLLEDAKVAGISLGVQSAYRSISYQQNNFDNDVKKYQNQGYDKTKAVELTSKNIQPPRQSEHCAGLAIDFNTTENGQLFTLEESFENTKAFAWLSENAADYGFILRYPSGMTNLTGINYEPWHYRYIGTVHAKKLQSSGLTLEEYVKLPDVASQVVEPQA